MAKATWKEVVLAESESTEISDGFTYFPRSAVKLDHLKENDHRTT